MKKWYQSKSIIVAGLSFVTGLALCVTDGATTAEIILTVQSLGMGVLRALTKEGIIL